MRGLYLLGGMHHEDARLDEARQVLDRVPEAQAGHVDVADVDADAQLEVVATDLRLDLARTLHGRDRAVEARQGAVAHVVQHRAAVLGDLGMHDRAAALRGVHRAILVLAHQRGVARDVGEHDRDELAVRHGASLRVAGSLG